MMQEAEDAEDGEGGDRALGIGRLRRDLPRHAAWGRDQVSTVPHLKLWQMASHQA